MAHKHLKPLLVIHSWQFTVEIMAELADNKAAMSAGNCRPLHAIIEPENSVFPNKKGNTDSSSCYIRAGKCCCLEKELCEGTRVCVSYQSMPLW